MIITWQHALDNFLFGLILWFGMYAVHRHFRRSLRHVERRPLALFVFLCANPRGDRSISWLYGGLQLIAYVFIIGWPLGYLLRLSDFALTMTVVASIGAFLIAFFLHPTDTLR